MNILTNKYQGNERRKLELKIVFMCKAPQIYIQKKLFS